MTLPLWSVALLACAVVLLLDQVSRLRFRGLPALLLVPGAWLVHTGHIFSPDGVTGMLLLGVGTGLLGWFGSAKLLVPAEQPREPAARLSQ
jgi:hypothetical protein